MSEGLVLVAESAVLAIDARPLRSGTEAPTAA